MQARASHTVHKPARTGIGSASHVSDQADPSLGLRHTIAVDTVDIAVWNLPGSLTNPENTVIRTTLTAAVVALTTLVYGCGDGSSKPLDRAELIAKADAICRPVVKKIAYHTLTPKIIVQFAQQLADVEEAAYKRLSSLVPPASMVVSWQLIVDGYRESARDFRGLARLTEPQSSPGLFEPLYGDIRKSAWTAKEEGFKDCGEY